MCFEDQESFVKYYFEGDIKYCLCIQIYAIETLVSVIFKEIYIIYKYWHYNICLCYFEEDQKLCLFLFICVFAKIPK